MPLALPTSRAEIVRLQSARKRAAVENARRAPFHRERLAHVNVDRVDDPAEWSRIPILDKDQLRAMSDAAYRDDFCLPPPAGGIAEFWRSGGATGKPLFYPRSFEDMRYAMLSFRRVYECTGLAGRGGRVHDSFPLGIHPVGQILARAANAAGLAAVWAGAGTTTPSALQLELIQRLQPTIWMGMSSYGLHLANLAEAQGVDLAGCAVETVLCSAEPLSDAKRAKLERGWGARVLDTFGMTEAGMMGAEDAASPGGGFRIWTDLYFVEVVHPETHAPVADGEVGALVVTPLWTHTVTPFLRWLSGDLVVKTDADDASGPFAVFPKIRHAHRTTGFFKVRGVNVNHAELEDFLFANRAVTDFKCELVTVDDRDCMRLCVELARGADAAAASAALVESVKNTFEVTPEIVQLAPGTLAKEFESSVKAPRFADRRQ